ncbi:MAG: ELM1/GtrOC1 family putative glycosyltransferase [Hyphomicrobium sp.]
MQPLKALLVSDGRPGHFTLSEGILAAIARRRPVDIRRLEVRRPRLVPARVLSALTNHSVSPSRILSHVYAVDPSAVPFADVIVSAGGDTLAANIAISRLGGGLPNIFYGSLRRFKAADFALVLNSYARHSGDAKFLVTLKPNKLDPDDLLSSSSGKSLSVTNPPATAGLLLGGDTKLMAFGTANWQRIAEFVRAAHAQAGTHWMVSNSRRTPDSVSDQFANMAAETESPIVRFIDVRQAGSGTLREVFEACDALAVTADSSSMLSEAIWVRRPVVALAPDGSSLTPDEQDYRLFLSNSGWTSTVSLTGLTPEIWAKSLAQLTPLTANPQDLLAAELQRRLPQLFYGKS